MNTIFFKIQTDEEILWKGKYHPLVENSRSNALDFIFKFLSFLEDLVYYAIATFFVYLYLMKLIPGNEFIKIFIYLIAYILYCFFITFYSRKRDDSKLYFVTNQRVIFVEWSLWNGMASNFIWLKNVDKLSWQEFDHNIATIYFMGMELGEFKNTEHYPALVHIKNGKEVFERLNKII